MRAPTEQYPRVARFYVYSRRWAGVTMCGSCADTVVARETIRRCIPAANRYPPPYCHRCRLQDGWPDKDGVLRFLTA